jgi:hypothetical protein
LHLFTGVRGREILRTSPLRSSKNFAHVGWLKALRLEGFAPSGPGRRRACRERCSPFPWGAHEEHSEAPLATALGLVGTREEGEDALVHTTERRLRGDVTATFEELGQGEVGEDSARPRKDRPGGKERVLLGGEHSHRPTEAPEFLLGCRPGEIDVQPEVPEGGPELPDGGAEGGVLGLREQRHCRALEALLGGTEAVKERGGTDLEEHTQEGACGYGGRGDKRCPGDALGGYSHGPDGYGRPVGDADERRTLQAEAVEDVLSPEGMPVPLGRGASLRTKARLAYDVGRVEAVALGQRQEPLQAGGVQGVAAREEDDGRGALRAESEDVRVAEARADGQAFVAETQSGERLVVERSDLVLALGRFVDGFGRGAPPTREADMSS